MSGKHRLKINNSCFGRRAVSGLIFALLAVGATVWREWSFYVFWGLVGLLCGWEYYRLLGDAFRRGVEAVGTKGKRWGWFFGGTLYILVPIVLLTGLDPTMGWAPGGWAGGNGKMVVTLLFVVWMNDVGGYVVGVASGGRHKMAPRISPGKSWEGFFGGLLFGVGTAVVLYVLYWDGGGSGAGGLFVRDGGLERVKWVGFGLVVSLAGVGGDLIESKFKRTIGIKDSGRAIPGHGGFLDRFDALLLGTVAAWMYIRLIDLI